MMFRIFTLTIAGPVAALVLAGCVVIPIPIGGEPVIAPAQVVQPVLPVVTPVAGPVPPRPQVPQSYDDGNRPPEDDDDNPWN